jgi:hypothetical protein
MKELNKTFFLVVTLALTVGLGLVAAGPAVAQNCAEITITQEESQTILDILGQQYTLPGCNNVTFEVNPNEAVNAYLNGEQIPLPAESPYDCINATIYTPQNQVITAHLAEDNYALKFVDGCTSIALNGVPINPPVGRPNGQCANIVFTVVGNQTSATLDGQPLMPPVECANIVVTVEGNKTITATLNGQPIPVPTQYYGDCAHITIVDGNETITTDFENGNYQLQISDGCNTITFYGNVLPSCTAVVVQPGYTEMLAAARVQLTAMAYFSDSTSGDATYVANWSSSDNYVVYMDPYGGAHGVQLGTATVTATYNGIISDPVEVAVTGFSPSIVSVVVEPGNVTIDVGGTQQFTATASYSDGSTLDVTSTASWESIDVGVATVDSSGLATGVATGGTYITATYSGSMGYSLLIVGNPGAPPGAVKPVSVEVKPGNATKEVGETQEFTATAYFSGNISEDVTFAATWESSNKGVASINELGVATGVSAGTTNVKATFGNVSSNSAKLTVTAAPKPTVLTVVVEPASASILVGGTQQFTATAHYSDSSSKIVTSTASWDSSKVDVATLASGLATGVAAGVTDITATYSGITSGKAPLTVTAPKPTVESIVVQPGNSTFSVGGTQQFTATASYSDGSSKDVTNDVTWASSDNGVATIDSAGLATGIAVGDATITASLQQVSSNAVPVSVVPVSVPWAMIGGIIGGVLILGLLRSLLLRQRRSTQKA